MTENNPNQSGEISVQEPVSRFAKLQGYAGILLTLGIVALFLWPAKRFPSGIANYFNRTNLAVLIARTDRGAFVANMRSFESECKAALDKKPSVMQSQEALDRAARSACDIRYMLPYTGATMARLQAREPEVWPLSTEYRDLIRVAQIDQRLKETETPKMTPELRELGKRLLNLLIEEYNASTAWLGHANRILHTLVILFAVLGVVFRRQLGALVLAPFGVGVQLGRIGAKAAKEVHKRV